jgi:hypothetical protein
VLEIIKTPVGLNYENVARLWISNEKNCAVNMFTSAIIWNMWKMRNEIFFGKLTWSGIQMVWKRAGNLLRKWMPLCALRSKSMLEGWIRDLDVKATEIPRLKWR